MPPELFEALIDDAAVFPPGNAPLPLALDRHRAHGKGDHAADIGPLLVPAISAEALAQQLGSGTAIDVGLIVRPGGDPGEIASARTVLRSTQARVVGAEFGWSRDWRRHDLDLPLALELPRGDEQIPALDDIAAACAEGQKVVAKFRTGATPSWAWPDEAELAHVIVDTVRRGVPFKLTGGLHHALRGTYEVEGPPEENHGLLNVLVAVDAATAGDAVSVLIEALTERNVATLVSTVRGWSGDSVARIRNSFVSYGCCEVTDPLGELTALGLLPVHPSKALS